VLRCAATPLASGLPSLNKGGARPWVILRPKGSVVFFFDVSDTEPELGAPPLPLEVERPFEVRRGRVRREVELTIENAKRDGVSVSHQDLGGFQ
jgi:hypothetical protein